MAKAASGFAIAQRAIKAIAIVVGGACTFVAFSSLVGLATGNPWARGIVAALLTLALPAAVLERTLPRDPTAKPRPGLFGDVVAIVLLGVALIFVGVGQPVTRPLLVREGDRFAEAGHDILAHVVYFLAGVRPVDAAPPGAHDNPGR